MIVFYKLTSNKYIIMKITLLKNYYLLSILFLSFLNVYTSDNNDNLAPETKELAVTFTHGIVNIKREELTGRNNLEIEKFIALESRIDLIISKMEDMEDIARCLLRKYEQIVRTILEIGKVMSSERYSRSYIEAEEDVARCVLRKDEQIDRNILEIRKFMYSELYSRSYIKEEENVDRCVLRKEYVAKSFINPCLALTAENLIKFNKI